MFSFVRSGGPKELQARGRLRDRGATLCVLRGSFFLNCANAKFIGGCLRPRGSETFPILARDISSPNVVQINLTTEIFHFRATCEVGLERRQNFSNGYCALLWKARHASMVNYIYECEAPLYSTLYLFSSKLISGDGCGLTRTPQRPSFC